MDILRTLAIASLLALGACASTFRPDAVSDYFCSNTDVVFTVTYAWDPPHAQLNLHTEPPIDLPFTPSLQLEGRRNHYVFGERGGVLLEVERDFVFLHRPGQRTLRCEREVITVT